MFMGGPSGTEGLERKVYRCSRWNYTHDVHTVNITTRHHASTVGTSARSMRRTRSPTSDPGAAGLRRRLATLPHGAAPRRLRDGCGPTRGFVLPGCRRGLASRRPGACMRSGTSAAPWRRRRSRRRTPTRWPRRQATNAAGGHHGVGEISRRARGDLEKIGLPRERVEGSAVRPCMHGRAPRRFHLPRLRSGRPTTRRATGTTCRQSWGETSAPVG